LSGEYDFGLDFKLCFFNIVKDVVFHVAEGKLSIVQVCVPAACQSKLSLFRKLAEVQFEAWAVGKNLISLLAVGEVSLEEASAKITEFCWLDLSM
jgi:hypothetical protein